MSEIRNKIITISGEPASGKSTVVNMLKTKYKEMGYNVHIVTTGHIFRNRMKREFAKLYPDREYANLADLQTDEAFAAKRAEIDAAIDKMVAQMGIEINSESRPNDVYIIDSRLAWHNIPDSYAIRLTVDERIAGQRVFEDKRRGKEDAYKSIEDATEKTRQRKLGEIERFKKRYGVDLLDLKNYDLVIDTSYSNVEELAEIIINGEESYRNGVYYPKTWASPACFIGTQTDRQIWSDFGVAGCTPEDLSEIMKVKGFDPKLGEIDILENYGEKYVKDGHHRAMAAIAIGKTLIPYRAIRNEFLNAQMSDEQNNLNFAYDWSDCIQYYGGELGKQKQFEKFSVKNLTAYDRRIKILLDECLKKREDGTR